MRPEIGVRLAATEVGELPSPKGWVEGAMQSSHVEVTWLRGGLAALKLHRALEG